MIPILGRLVKNKIETKIISLGLKLTHLEIRNTGIRFIDSVNFTLIPIAKFPESFGFKGNKGNFPHHFIKTKNQNYISKYPALKY